MLPLRHLRTVNAVAAGGGVRASSETLLRAASAVSRSIALLEQASALPLFERKGRGMVPTAAGALLQRRYAAIAAELSAVEAEAAAAASRSDPLPATAIDVLFDERRLMAASLLADLNHMPTVARRLGVTQPAVSAAVARLEGALRQKLFLRTARGLLPTDLGARWVLRFDRALAELRYLQDDLAALRGQVQGVVSVGALPMARTRLLPRAIAAVRASHAQLRIHSIESPYEQLCADLLRGRIDFIIGALRPLVDEALRNESLFVEDLGIIAAASHPLQRKRRLSLADVRGESWVLSRPGTPLRADLDAYFARHGEPAPVPAVETGDLAMVRGMLLDGGMVTVLSTHQLRYELEAGQVRVLPIALDGLRREIGITTRRGAQLPPGAEALLGEIRTLVQDQRGGL
ncbi:LysR family transcriptional regulator [Ramlibacter sp. G-1-2-2]|uniref:LysR family transcriptional regulator n=1 Tax=Ramlibacter agri TaxID=2728837 RepID=A0A848H3Q4_9BURK|nr:LysR family transcriptional regulator [Ramlibacter agri]NML43283.1 LysR family transcriptional regulator [Ramlibacter agri]